MSLSLAALALTAFAWIAPCFPSLLDSDGVLERAAELVVRGAGGRCVRQANPGGSRVILVDLDFCRETDKVLRRIRHLRSVRSLSLKGSDVTGQGLLCLAQWPALEELYLNGCQGLEGEVQLGLFFPLLKKLDVSKVSFKPGCRQWIAAHKTLVELRMGSSFVREGDLKDVSKLTALQVLDISGHGVTRNGFRAVRHLKELRELYAYGVVERDEWLADVGGLKKLEVLDLRHSGVDGPGLGWLCECVRLRVVKLEWSSVGNVGMGHLAKLPALQEVRVDKSPVTEDGLLELRKCRSLRRLSYDCELTIDGMRALLAPGLLESADLNFERGSGVAVARLKGLEALRSVTMVGEYSDDDMCNILHRVAGLRQLTAGRLNDRICEAIGGLKGLEDLWVASDGFEETTEVGFGHLSQLKNLKVLYTMGGEIGDAKLKRICGCQSLKKLELIGAKITDDGVRCLTALDSLEELSLACSRITDEGIQCLRELPRLKVLSLYMTGVTAEGAARLRRHRPDLKIWVEYPGF